MFSRLVATLLISSTVATGLQAASFELPSLNSPDSNEHHAGKIIWADLVTPDMAAAQRFYGGLFGWTFQSISAGKSDYVVASNNGHAIAGIVEKPNSGTARHQSAWLTFISVRDVDAATRTALAHKGKVLTSATTYLKRGRQVVMADPEGAVFALLASSSGDPPDELAASGEWIWSSLHARDAGAEAGFYQELFGYEVYDQDSEDGIEHVLLASDEYARASANGFPDGKGRRHAHWLNFVRVTSAVESAAKAASLGGKVLVEPHEDRHGGMVAVVADSAGAPVGLMEWSDEDTKAEPK
jgi:uncharacterized protein